MTRHLTESDAQDGDHTYGAKGRAGSVAVHAPPHSTQVGVHPAPRCGAAHVSHSTLARIVCEPQYWHSHGIITSPSAIHASVYSAELLTRARDYRAKSMSRKHPAARIRATASTTRLPAPPSSSSSGSCARTRRARAPKKSGGQECVRRIRITTEALLKSTHSRVGPARERPARDCRGHAGPALESVRLYALDKLTLKGQRPA